MFRLVVLTTLAAVCAAQNVDPKNAKILKEQRFNAGDGRAGSAFASEDGTVFREETDLSGNRVGQYSYIGDNGQTFTVKYVAGKDGFRIISGDHIPSGGQDAAAFVADPDAGLREEDRPILRAEPAPRPAQRPAPRPLAAVPEPRPQPAFEPQPAKDPNFNPFINPHDPTHRNFQFNKNAIQFNPENPLAKQLSLVPDCAGCKGVNPFVNPFDETHSAGGLLAGHQAGFGIPQPAAPRARPAPQPVAPVQPAARPIRPTPTPAPRNFFPPGQLKLNRFETGFNFDFES